MHVFPNPITFVHRITDTRSVLVTLIYASAAYHDQLEIISARLILGSP